MRAFLLCVAVVGWSVALFGCGDGDPSEADPSKPLVGKELGKVSQLEGTWFALTEGGFVGFEFMEDKKVLVTPAWGGVDSGVMMSYDVLDGGRLALTAQAGQTQVFGAVVAGDQLELKGSMPQSGVDVQRFRKLKSGETLASALKADREAKVKAYQERLAAIEAFIQKPGLVLACTSAAPGAPPAAALDVKFAGGSFQGQAWHDDRRPRLNVISGGLNQNDRSQSSQVTIRFGQRIAPPATQADGAGQITLNVEGDARAMKITGQVTYGDGTTTYELALTSDPKRHAEIVKRFDAELVRMETLKQPLIAALKDFTVLRGRMQPMTANQPNPDTTELVLARDAASGQYRVEGAWVSGMQGRGERVTAAAAAIMIDANEQAWLRIVTPPSRSYMLTLSDPKAGRLSGRWEPTGYNQGANAQFELIEALDAAARDAKFAAQRAQLQSIRADSVLVGLAHESSGFGMDMPIPFRLRLTVAPDGSVTGKADYPSMSTLMTVTGKVADTLRGPRLELGYTGAESTPGDQIFFRSLAGGTWSFAPVGGDGAFELDGYFTVPSLRSTTLTLVNAESTAQLRKQLVDAMGRGGQFYMSKFVGWQSQGLAPFVAEWTLDDASGKLTGRKIADDKPQFETLFEGQIKQDGGWIALELFAITPYRAQRSTVAYKLWVALDSGGSLHLNGATLGLPNGPADQPLPPFPERLDRLVEFIPVASTDAQRRAAIDATITATSKARADAAAATAATQAAAQDALRARLAPYLTCVQAKSGAVITSDAAADMGALLTEVKLNDAQTAVSGKGIDLRAFPYREFTFEGVTDNYGQLVITTSLSRAPYAFKATAKGMIGRYMALAELTEAERARIDARIALAKRLAAAEPKVLSVQTVEAAPAKAREANLGAVSMPGVAIYKDHKNDQVAAMFIATANGRYRWAKEPITLRLAEPVKGSALYIKGGGATDNLTVVINGVHRALIPAIVPLGAAIIMLPPDLEIFDLRLEAGGTAQARAVVLLPR